MLCLGKSCREYRFSVAGQEFAWRRTRDKQLGSLGKGHRDFKLIALLWESLSTPSSYTGDSDSAINNNEDLIDLSSETHRGTGSSQLRGQERILAVYIQQRDHSRHANIKFFETLPWSIELWCLTAVLGLQEKIQRNLVSSICCLQTDTPLIFTPIHRRPV